MALMLWQRLAITFGDHVPRDPMTLGSLALAGIGTAVSAAGTLAAGADADKAYQFKARQEDMAAQESRASSQRGALEKRREGELIQSKLQARAAASGAGASDPGVVALGEDIAGRGEYESLMEMYKGENRARGLEDKAMASRMSGDAARTGSYFNAAGTIIKGATSMYDRFNRLAPAYG